MEVEAKFSLPDIESLHRLEAATRLAGFRLARGQRKAVRDTYMDTADRKILAGGFSCRFRMENEGIRVTLKGIGGASGAIHKREETEILLPAIIPPEKWEDSPLRSQVLQLTCGEPILTLFELDQMRSAKPVRFQGETIAELSLDEVHVVSGDMEQAYYELEVELTSHGKEEQLTKIADYLEQKWRLHAEPLSKFERALNPLDLKSEYKLLDVQVRETLVRISEREDWYGQRSRALLALDKGLQMEEVGRQVQRSRRTIRRWLADFRKVSLGSFPASILEASIQPGSTSQVSIPSGEQTQIFVPSPKPPAPRIKLPRKVGLHADDVMAEVTRKIIHFQFQHMLYHEAGTQMGQEIEELHDMRVATRRMRAALHVFGDYLDDDTWAPFDKGLRRTGRILGEVRDLDVFWEKTQL
jgi:inorganic triphosphatase YgiF